MEVDSAVGSLVVSTLQCLSETACVSVVKQFPIITVLFEWTDIYYAEYS